MLDDAERFVFTSSIAVYGAGQLPMREDMPPTPEDPYGISKYAVELDLAAAHQMFGLDYTVFRPHNVYGERQNVADRYRNVIGIFMNNVMQGMPMPVFGDGLQTRAFSHIADVAPIIARPRSSTAPANEVFNVGADQPYTILELAKAIAAAFEVEPDIVHLESRATRSSTPSRITPRCAQVFGAGDPIPLEEGIQRMAAWAREQGPRPPVEFCGEIEVRDQPAPRAGASASPERSNGRRA